MHDFHKDLADHLGCDEARLRPVVWTHGRRIPGTLFVRGGALRGAFGDQANAVLRSMLIRTAGAPEITRVILSRLHLRGGLNLAIQNPQLTVFFHRCRIGGRLDLGTSRFGRLRLERTSLSSLSADGLDLAHELRLNRVSVDRSMALKAAKIGGDMVISATRLWRPGETPKPGQGPDAALFAPGLDVAGSLVLGPATAVRNHVVIDGAHIKQKLVLAGFRLGLDDPRVGPKLFRGHGIRVDETAIVAPMSYARRRIGDFEGGPVESSGSSTTMYGALDLQSAVFGEDVVFSQSQIQTRPIVLPRTYPPEKVAQLSFDTKPRNALVIDGFPDIAIHLRGAKVEGRIYLNGSRILGQVDATNTEIGSDLICDAAEIFAFTSAALRMGGARIGGTIFLGQRENRAHDISGQETRIAGRVRLKHAQIDEDLSMSGCIFYPSRAGSGLDVRNAKIGGTLNLPVQEPYSGPNFSYIPGDASVPSSGQGKQSRPRELAQEVMRLDGAEVQSLSFHDERSWPDGTVCTLAGFTYRLRSPEVAKIRTLFGVCERSHGAPHNFVAQPFAHLAEEAARNGDLAESKDILIRLESFRGRAHREYEREAIEVASARQSEKDRVARGEAKEQFRRVRTAAEGLPRWRRPAQVGPAWIGLWWGLSWIWLRGALRRGWRGAAYAVRQRSVRSVRGIYRLTGYGHRPQYVVFLLLAGYIGLVIGLYVMGGEELFVPTNLSLLTNTEYIENCSLPVGYRAFILPWFAFDTIIPFVDVGMQSHWQIGDRPCDSVETGVGKLRTGWLLVTLGRSFGWVCATLVVASVTSVVKK
ncbi:MAG: hypothetical protein AAFU80_16145 [Pseudomonadota bacterium]